MKKKIFSIADACAFWRFEYDAEFGTRTVSPAIVARWAIKHRKISTLSLSWPLGQHFGMNNWDSEMFTLADYILGVRTKPARLRRLNKVLKARVLSPAFFESL